jgi:MFS family permease
MTVLAACGGLICLLFVKDAASPAAEAAAQGKRPAAAARDWVYREAALTPQFMIIAAAMVLTQACVTTVQSAGVSHLAKLGDTAEFAALMLSLQSMLATLAKGASGTLSEVIPPKQLLVIGLVIECLGMVLLAHAQSHALSYAFALAFGIGWGAAYLSVTVLLINYFGPNTGSAALSTVWLLAGVAAIGPIAAGMVADRFGSFSPVFTIGGLLLLPVALGLLIMRAPSRRAAEALPLVAAAGRSR